MWIPQQPVRVTEPVGALPIVIFKPPWPRLHLPEMKFGSLQAPIFPPQGPIEPSPLILPDSVAVYGGFDGSETMLSQRDWNTNFSILSGDIGMGGTTTDNSYHVLTSQNTGPLCVLDGIIISDGVSIGAASEHGAGMVCTASSMTLANCTIRDNEAGGMASFVFILGGGMFNDNSSPTITNCTFDNNSCASFIGANGGAIGNGGSSSPVISGCTFSNNSGQVAGAIAYGGGVTATIDDCLFLDNIGINTAVISIGFGDSITITRSIFRDNYETGGGGANVGVINGSLRMDSCIIEAVSPSGSLVRGLDVSNGGILDISTTVFFRLNSSVGAAAIEAASGSLVLVDNCEILECTSGNAGGAFEIAPHSMANSAVTNCKFRGNQSEFGAAIYYGAFGTHALGNCEFVNNTSSANYIGGGAVLSSNTPRLDILNCSFGGNESAHGGGGAGFYGDGGDTVTVKNCIFWDDITGHGIEIDTNANVVLNITYSDVQGGWAGTGNLNMDPLFINPNGPDWTRATIDDNLRLNPCSPVIDMGDNAGVNFPVDADGNTRIFNGTVDMGVYEIQGLVCPVNALFLGNDTSICIGDTLILDAGPDFASYSWSTGDTVQTISVATAGTYSVTVTDTNGLTGMDTINIGVNPLPIVVVTPDSATICPGDSIQLDGTDPSIASYLWNTGETSSMIFAGQPGTYTLIATSINSCVDSATAEIFNFPTPSTTLGPDTAYCVGDTFVLDGGAGFASYLWSGGFSGRYLDVTRPGEYILLATDSNSCQVLDTVNILEEALPSVTLGGDQSVCDGNSVTLDAGSGYSSYLWSNGDSLQSIVVTVDGAYFVEVTSQLGCMGTSDIATITVNPNPDPTIAYTTDGTELTTQMFDSYIWSFNGTAITGGTNQSTPVTGSGLYTVEVTNSFGCTGVDSFVVLTTTVTIPEGFSPNDDNINDNLVISNIDLYPGNEVIIFNRWGGEVFRTTDYQNDWRGLGRNDKPLPDGTYYYIVDLKQDDEEPKNGYIIISR